MRRFLVIALGAVGLLAVAVGGFAFVSGETAQVAANGTVIRSKTVTIPSLDESEKYVRAAFGVSCNPGETAIGGGYRAPGEVWLLSSYPIDAATWVTVLTSDNSSRKRGTVYAVCQT